jgi:PAS domain S-box-containing protein
VDNISVKEIRSGQFKKIGSDAQHILDALPFGVLLVDQGYHILAANEGIKRYFGIEERQLVGTYCPLAMHQSSEPVDGCPLTEAIEKGSAVEKEIFDAENSRWINAGIYPTPMTTVDDKAIYVHFVRDITEHKNTEIALAHNLEHHRALCDLLNNLQYCRNSTQIFENLLHKVLPLSWLGVTATAACFLIKGSSLEMVAHQNISPEILKRCRRLALGECLCGKVAQTGRRIVCSSDSPDHVVRWDNMAAHKHVILPIKHNGQTHGILTLYMNPEAVMDDFRLGFLEAAAASAGAALDAQLAKEETLKTQEKLLAQVISSQENERKRVATDLHDQLCQSLSAILLEVQAKEGFNKAEKPAQIALESRIRNLIDYVRQMAGELRPTVLDDYGLEKALDRTIKELSKRTEIPIDFQYFCSEEKKERPPASVEVALYRVAMEAIDNAITHANASNISIILVCQQRKMRLLVEDDGCGFDYEKLRKDMDRCRGLLEMEERVAVLGGTLQIESSSKRGTTVRAEFCSENIRN